MHARTALCSFVFLLLFQALTGCAARTGPQARLTWVTIDLQADTQHPAARRLRELAAAASPDTKTSTRLLQTGEMNVLLDQITRDGVGRPRAYVSLGTNGAPSEARSYSSIPGSPENRQAEGILVLVEARPVPGQPAKFEIADRSMSGNSDGYLGGQTTGNIIDLHRDMGRTLGGGRSWGGPFETLRLFVVEPVTLQTPELNYTPDQVLPHRER